MGKFQLILPSMGESVAEATLTSWLKEVGDSISADDAVVEVATDKVDSDVPSEVSGVLIEKRFKVNDVIQVGEVIAVIESEEITKEENKEAAVADTEATSAFSISELPPPVFEEEFVSKAVIEELEDEIQKPLNLVSDTQQTLSFLSPLVKNIIKKEGITDEELAQIKGTGDKNRITKNDMLSFLAKRKEHPKKQESPSISSSPTQPKLVSPPKATDGVVTESGDQIIEMGRMAQLISNHMVESKNTSVHVQSFVEADVTDLWDWREKVKHDFQDREGEKLTFTPIFIAAIIHALKTYPLLNSSVNGDQIIQKKNINIGMATALGDGNLIVPVIKNADHLNLVGLAKSVNDLSLRARNNALQPDEVKGGTYTVTNIGNFGSITGTPIINQPQVGILALGVIRKMPSVIETPEGDFVGIRRKIILSHSYDHRIINGAMGGQFVKTVAQYLEDWDTTITF